MAIVPIQREQALIADYRSSSPGERLVEVARRMLEDDPSLWFGLDIHMPQIEAIRFDQTTNRLMVPIGPRARAKDASAFREAFRNVTQFRGMRFYYDPSAQSGP